MICGRMTAGGRARGKERKMTELLGQKELQILNDALRRGRDVEVQRTRDGVRILEKRVRVLDRKIAEELAGKDER